MQLSGTPPCTAPAEMMAVSPLCKVLVFPSTDKEKLPLNTSIISYSREALERIHTDIEQFAECEKLTAHANSIKVRFED